MLKLVCQRACNNFAAAALDCCHHVMKDACLTGIELAHAVLLCTLLAGCYRGYMSAGLSGIKGLQAST